jgi:hypothetical protein
LDLCVDVFLAYSAFRVYAETMETLIGLSFFASLFVVARIFREFKMGMVANVVVAAVLIVGFPVLVGLLLRP